MTQTPAALDWLIIGGGIHGVHIAARLLGDADVAPDRLRIVDPGDQLLERWRTCAATTGMSHLRSPSAHHLDVDPWSLDRFARGRSHKRKRGLLARPFKRPALTLFNEHCDKVVQAFGLKDLHIQDRAKRCSVDCDGAVVQLSSGREIAAQNLVLAIGSGEQPSWPDWAPRSHARVHHIFEPGFDGWPPANEPLSETVGVIGGGISAGQVALRLMAEGHRVHLVSRHPLRQHQFDSDPGWLGPFRMAGFSREPDFDRRRSLIAEARHRGSVPPDVRRSLSQAIEQGHLHWHQDKVESLEARGDGLVLGLAAYAELEVERVLLATGFTSSRPGGSMIDALIASASLPCANCGYPIVDSALRWHPRVYVSGPLAELELGPASRNIAGARRAGDRLVDAAKAS
ncbi:MAG: FAD/NAD(P)-binding protein [Acidobacteriota bacterium]